MLKGSHSYQTLDDFKRENAALGREAFLGKYFTNFIVLTCPLYDQASLNFKTCSYPMPGALPKNRMVTRVQSVSKSGDAEYHMVTVGRTSNNDICIPLGNISKFHAYFMKDHKTGGTTIVDAGSTNCTQVNMQPLTPREPRLLLNGDRITFGKDIRAEFLTAEGMWTLVSQSQALEQRAARYHAF